MAGKDKYYGTQEEYDNIKKWLTKNNKKFEVNVGSSFTTTPKGSIEEPIVDTWEAIDFLYPKESTCLEHRQIINFRSEEFKEWFYKNYFTMKKIKEFVFKEGWQNVVAESYHSKDMFLVDKTNATIKIVGGVQDEEFKDRFWVQKLFYRDGMPEFSIDYIFDSQSSDFIVFDNLDQAVALVKKLNCQVTSETYEKLLFTSESKRKDAESRVTSQKRSNFELNDALFALLHESSFIVKALEKAAARGHILDEMSPVSGKAETRGWQKLKNAITCAERFCTDYTLPF